MSAIATVAHALCYADKQRHLAPNSRGGTPCRGHVEAAWVACAALVDLIGRELLTPDEAKQDNGEGGAALRSVYRLLTAQPDDL